MPLLFKMQKALVTFSFTLIIKVRILDIPKLSRNEKGYLISQNFWWMQRDEKNKNSLLNCLITYMFTNLLFITEGMTRQSTSASRKWNAEYKTHWNIFSFTTTGLLEICFYGQETTFKTLNLDSFVNVKKLFWKLKFYNTIEDWVFLCLPNLKKCLE